MFHSTFLNVIAFFYNWIIKIGSNLQSLFLLWMRLTWGHQFLLAGLKKHQSIQTTAEFFKNIQIVHPEIIAYLVTYLEIIGGICLMVGFASRLVSIPLSIAMLGALGTVHWENLAEFKIFTNPASLVVQTPYPFLITCLLVWFFGPGRISIDAWLKRWLDRLPKF